MEKCPTCGYSMRKRGHVQEMVVMAKEGKTVREIADTLGVSTQAVYKSLKNRATPYKRVNHPRSRGADG